MAGQRFPFHSQTTIFKSLQSHLVYFLPYYDNDATAEVATAAGAAPILLLCLLCSCLGRWALLTKVLEF